MAWEEVNPFHPVYRVAVACYFLGGLAMIGWAILGDTSHGGWLVLLLCLGAGLIGLAAWNLRRATGVRVHPGAGIELRPWLRRSRMIDKRHIAAIVQTGRREDEQVPSTNLLMLSGRQMWLPVSDLRPAVRMAQQPGVPIRAEALHGKGTVPPR